MTAKEYLMQYRQSMERTAEIETHLHELKAEAIQLKDHEGQSVALDDAVAKYTDACDEYGHELNRLAALRGEIRGTIDSVPDKRLRSLLREIYINEKRLVQIAAERNQSYEHICRRHGDALNAVRAVRGDLE